MDKENKKFVIAACVAAFFLTYALFYFSVNFFGSPSEEAVQEKEAVQEEEYVTETISETAEEEFDTAMENESSTKDTENQSYESKGDVKITKPTIVAYEDSDGEKRDTCYIRLINQGDSYAEVLGVLCVVKDTNSEVVDEIYCLFAPKVLKPNQTGVAILLPDTDRDYSLNEMNVDAYIVSEKTEEQANPLKCTSSELVDYSTLQAGNMTDNSVQVTVQNNSDEDIEAMVICGLLNSSDEMIGYATSWKAKVLANDSSEVICFLNILKDGTSAEDIATFQPRVLNLSELTEQE